MGAVRDAVLLLFISDDPAVVVRKEASKTRKSRVVPLVDPQSRETHREARREALRRFCRAGYAAVRLSRDQMTSGFVIARPLFLFLEMYYNSEKSNSINFFGMESLWRKS